MVKKLWGGRFDKETDPLVEKFTRSIQYDEQLAIFDIVGSILHVQILSKSKYLTPEEADKLLKELRSIRGSIVNKEFNFDKQCEDIHTNIQNILEERLGDVALKLHMARSRNDQVVFSTKLYCKMAMKVLEGDIAKLISAIEDLVSRNDIIIPGFTHMQHAQPVYLKDYLGAYVGMLKRDMDRLSYISQHIKIYMGAGALAGTPIDSVEYCKNLNEVIAEFENLKKLTEKMMIEPTPNSLDSVSDRDFIIEIISALSIIAMHLSRLSEDLIIWSTKEFDFIEIDEAFCTGSSLMPQKKNPDVLELIRGYTGRLYGNLVSVLTMMKGLPLTYNRDMQLDKEPLFDSFEKVSDELNVLSGLIKTLKFNELSIKKHLEDESLYATDLVYYLVKKGEPFKKAHGVIGELIKDSLKRAGGIRGMDDSELKKYSDKFDKREMESLRIFDPRVSVESKKSIKR